jgi:RNA polymerase-interacting CarD/CdnL/TRCF family regulator
MEREMASRQGKLSAYAAMISACEKSSRDETLSEQERLVYAKMEKRLSDMMEAVVRP